MGSVDAGGRAGREGRWPFTGRAADLELIGEAYRLAEVGGVVVTGPAGVGKSRLVDEALALAERAGRPIARAVGHASARDIPLGALAHLLPAELIAEAGVGPEGRTTLFHAARVTLTEMGGEDRLILFVDDVDLLDDTSLALLVPLVVSRSLFVVGTVRAARETSGRLAGLQRDGHLVRIALDPLAVDDVDTLLHRALDGPVSERALAELQRLSGGNLQILHELVRAGRDRGTFVRTAGEWDLVGPTATTVELEDLVSEHLDAVDEVGREVLELLAVCERLGLPDLEAEFGAGPLERLEGDGLVEVVVSERRAYVRLTHPLYGEVLAARLPPLRGRSIRRRLADLVEGHGARRREDQVRVVRWRLDSGGSVEPEQALGAARLALVGHDAALATRILRDAFPDGTSDEERGERLLVLVQAAARTGDLAEVERVFGGADELDVSDSLRARLAIRLADARFFAGRDLDGAVAACTDAADRVTDPAVRASLDAERAVLLANAGRPADALTVLDDLDRLVAEDAGVELDPRTAVDVDVARSASLISVGRCREGAEVARRAARAQAALPGPARQGAARHVINEAHALGYAGHHRQAYDLLLAAADRSRASGAWAAWVWFEMALGEVTRDMGRGDESVRRCEAVVEAATAAGQEAALVWAHVGVAQAHLLMGRCDDAEPAIERATAVGTSPVATSEGTLERARAWLEACRGDLPAARARLRRAAAVEAEAGVLLFESALCHDIARFGDPALVADRLDELAGRSDGPIHTAFAHHARALVDGDADALERAVDEFEALDSLAYAAEAAAELADVHARAGRQREATAARHRAAAIAARAGGVATPPLRRGTGVDPLTAREREIALLASGGATSREIGERLHLSARTVDTHLARVYRKLGISGRAGLAGALAVTDPAPT